MNKILSVKEIKLENKFTLEFLYKDQTQFGWHINYDIIKPYYENVLSRIIDKFDIQILMAKDDTAQKVLNGYEFKMDSYVYNEEYDYFKIQLNLNKEIISRLFSYYELYRFTMNFNEFYIEINGKKIAKLIIYLETLTVEPLSSLNNDYEALIALLSDITTDIKRQLSTDWINNKAGLLFDFTNENNLREQIDKLEYIDNKLVIADIIKLLNSNLERDIKKVVLYKLLDKKNTQVNFHITEELGEYKEDLRMIINDLYVQEIDLINTLFDVTSEGNIYDMLKIILRFKILLSVNKHPILKFDDLPDEMKDELISNLNSKYYLIRKSTFHIFFDGWLFIKLYTNNLRLKESILKRCLKEIKSGNKDFLNHHVLLLNMTQENKKFILGESANYNVDDIKETIEYLFSL